MKRSVGRKSLVFLFGILAIGWAVLDGKARDATNSNPAKGQPNKSPEPIRATAKKDAGSALVLGKLSRPAKFVGFDDPKTTFQDAVDHLAARYDVHIDVDETLFRSEMVADVMSLSIAEKALPAMKEVSLDRVLRKVLARLPVPATYLIRRDGIEITTVRAQRVEIWGAGYEGPFLPLAHASFEKRPLNKALQELAETTGFSVVLDARAGDKAQIAVTATFTNLPLDTAVRMLADMAGLKTSQNDNVIYVTADARTAKLRVDPENEPGVPGGAGILGGGCLSGFVPGLGFGGGVLGSGGGGALGALGGMLGFGGGMPGNSGLCAPVKSGKFDKKPVTYALKQVLESTSYKLIVDQPRAGEKAAAPVTVDLDDVPLETALRLLANLADLKILILDNVAYLTTRQNGDVLEREQERRLQNALYPLFGGAKPPPEKK